MSVRPCLRLTACACPCLCLSPRLPCHFLSAWAVQQQVRLVLPASLKKVLLADYEAVTRAGLLVPLPRKPNVGDILAQVSFLSVRLPACLPP
jgi:MRG